MQVEKTVREIFADNLCCIMEEKGKSQADIRRELNISSTTVSDWCNGKKYPRVDTIERIADYLGVSYTDLAVEGAYSKTDRELVKVVRCNDCKKRFTEECGLRLTYMPRDDMFYCAAGRVK